MTLRAAGMRQISGSLCHEDGFSAAGFSGSNFVTYPQ